MGCGGSKASADVVEEGFDDVKIVKDPEVERLKREAMDADAKAKVEEEASAKQQAAELKAVTRLQSRARGNADRHKVELRKRACDHYRVNMQAEKFGECMCGWPKAKHSAEALAKSAAKSTKLQRLGSKELRDEMLKKDKCACTRYVVNMESANFGECMCGEAKANHSEAALSAGEVAKVARVDSSEVRAKFVQKQFAECDKFEADLNASEFGVCVCGRKRADHSEAALAAAAKSGRGLGQRVASGDLQKAFVQKEFAECEHYEVLMGDNTVAFGTCVCGRPRSEHSEAALEKGAHQGASAGRSRQPTRKDSAEVRKGFEKTAAWEDRACVPCVKFELDMAPTAAFGTCVCGEPKAKHSDAALAAR